MWSKVDERWGSSCVPSARFDKLEPRIQVCLLAQKKGIQTQKRWDAKVNASAIPKGKRRSHAYLRFLPPAPGPPLDEPPGPGPPFLIPCGFLTEA
jgi:hypothetical protein